MTLRFNYWSHPAGSTRDRNYVSGLAVQGRVYLHRTLGSVTLPADDASPQTRKGLLESVRASAGAGRQSEGAF